MTKRRAALKKGTFLSRSLPNGGKPVRGGQRKSAEKPPRLVTAKIRGERQKVASNPQRERAKTLRKLKRWHRQTVLDHGRDSPKAKKLRQRINDL